MTKKKFKPGNKVKNMGELSALLVRECWIYIGHKAYRHGWTQGLSFRYLHGAVRLGQVRRAVRL